jgi:myxalamid-type polyketide synthase MxaC
VDAGLGAHPVLRDGAFVAMLVLEEHRPRRVHVAFERRDEDSGTVRLWSRGVSDDPGQAQWTLHGSAEVTRGRTEAGDASRLDDVSGILSRCFERLPTVAFYQGLWESGLTYGPALRRLDDIWRRDSEALGRLREVDPVESSSYVLDPALLDAAFHALAAALPNALERVGAGSALLPTAIREVRIHRPLVPRLRAHAVLSDGSSFEEGRLTGDVRIVDDEGQAFVEILGIELRRGASLRESRPSAETIWSYAVEWQQTSRGIAGPASGASWLLLAPRSTLALSLVEALRSAGARCTIVWPGEGFEVLGESELSVDVRCVEDMERVLREFHATASSVRYIVHLWNSEVLEECADGSHLAVAERTGAGAVLNLIQAMARAIPFDFPRLAIVTRGAQPADESAVSPSHSPLWGLGKAIALEHPELRCKRIDLESTAFESEAEALLAELCSDSEDGEIAIRRTGRWVARLVQMALPHLTDRRRVLPDGCYLIAGGLGGIGLAAARWLADAGARQLVLVGRSGASPAAESTLEALRRSGVEVLVRAVDIAQYDPLAAVLAEMREQMQPLRGVLHCAGVLEDDRLLQLTRARLSSALAPKVQGAWNLHVACRDDALEFFVLFSSAASVLGSPGQGAYCAANAFLDSLTHARHRQRLPSLGLNWGPWAEVGMAALGHGQLATGLSAIGVAHGFELIERSLQDANLVQATVVPFNVRDLIQFYPTGARATYFDALLGEDIDLLRSAGKVGRLYARPDLDHEYTAPRNPIESVIAGIWQRSLGVDRVGVDDSFFELGGDSIFASHVLIQVNAAFRVALDAQDAFTDFTVAHLAAMVDAQLDAIVGAMSQAELDALTAASNAPRDARDVAAP